MEDTDWRPSPCPKCGKLREAGRNPVCKNPKCKVNDSKKVKLYVLKDWDGADGTMNRKNGFIVETKKLAEQWVKNTMGGSYDKIEGVIISDLEEMKTAKTEMKRQKALNKLTAEERELLGL